MEELRKKIANESIPLDEVEKACLNKALLLGPMGKKDIKIVRDKSRKDEKKRLGVDVYKTKYYDGKFIKKQALVD
jgi:hypothetical protein